MDSNNSNIVTEQQEIPLFPLQRVLYPCVALPLQIFEQRYLRLVKESLASQTAFGIVPLATGREVMAEQGVTSAPEIVCRGTLVNIIDWSQLPNGLLGIVVKGVQKFTVHSTRIENDGLLLGKITFDALEEPAPLGLEDMDLVALLIDLVKNLGVEEYYLDPYLAATLADGLEGDQLLDDDGVTNELNQLALVWRLADLLPVTRSKKIAFFDLADPTARLEELRRWLLELQSR